MFLQVVRAFRSRWPDAAITVVLPVDGLLAVELGKLVSDVRILPMVVLRRARPVATLRSLIGAPWQVARAARLMNRYDLVYISTVVALDHLFATRFTKTPALIHIHELPTGRTQALFAAILRRTRGFLLFISAAVRAAFPQLAGRPGAVVWNGVRAFAPVARPASDTINLLMIGRFNAWKGQDLLIEAVARLPVERRRALKVRLVGSAFAGQEHFERAAETLIAERGLGDCIEIHRFVRDPEPFYAWADVVAVPSTRPEPFGLVAIEGMSAGCATIAADHGGLSEIVVDGETGRLFAPGDADRLADALLAYLDDPALARSHGAAGRRRFEREFGEDRFLDRIADLAADRLAADKIMRL